MGTEDFMYDTFLQMDEFFREGDLVVRILSCVLLFVTGSVVASFSGLVAYRLRNMDPDDSILSVISAPPSHCEHCGRRLSPLDLVPVLGWIAARGRCRGCGERVPAKYPVTEFVLGAFAASCPFLFGGLVDAMLPALLALTAFLIAAVDWECALVPEELTWMLLFGGLFASRFEGDTDLRIYGAALAAGLAWLMTTVPGWIKGADTRAWGDVAMAAGVGAWLGVYAVVPVMMAAAGLQLAVGVFAGAALDRLRPDGEDGVWVPFGPALMAAFVAGTVLFPQARALVAP